MDKSFYKTTGIALLTGSLLMIVTMVLHPFGGSMEHLLKIADRIMYTHVLAIFSLPIILFGFYGLSLKLSDARRITMLALIVMGFGLIAAMLAALFNGLVVPYFLMGYAETLNEHKDALEPILDFSFSVNKALDYVFIAGCCIAISLYSLVIVKSGTIARWIGYLGMLLIAFALLGVLTGYGFTSLTGFRIFIFGLALWVLLCGFSLVQSKSIEQ